MTDLLWALVIPLAVLSVLQLMFTLAVVRRLREHTEALRTLNEMFQVPPSGLPVGAPVPVLSATTEDGVPLDLPGSGERWLAFVSATCSHCRTHLPEFVAEHGGPDAVVIMSGDRAQGADLVQLATGAAQVVVEPDEGPWTSAFNIHVFPTFVRVVDGTVQAAGNAVADLAIAVPG